ncbi:GH92 family glycosyl hydrolase [Sphingobacterium daejeonense]|uniref:GH92 family glycosyl hydrolase n=1 Tax=Sphingobacterium daejeonense TaxID=371142 RepID=UPI0021A43185|nr:GH92 family glycosyl hydrolase [Sphingobacterium daejeonense]MCT1531664.1 GH92 family glycosyl hydrolase [Sphingobacterium daejeonense]
MFSIRLPQLGKVWSKTKSIMPLALMCISAFQTFAQKTEVDYVNPYMGNISHLLVPTFPTVHLPNSLLRVYPERGDYTSDRINGLPLIVTSHRGSSAFNLSPLTSGSRELEPVINYSYDQETINPYSYSVYLDQDNIQVDFAVSHQSAIYELNFEKEGTPQLIFNTRKGDIKWDGKGLSGSQDIGNNTKVYLYAEFQKQPAQIGSIKNGKVSNNSESSGENANVILTFPNGTKSVSVRYGISFIDAAQAKANVNREIKDFDLANIKEIGKQTWNNALGKLKVEGNNENDKNIFYTSLYRTFERPVNISEDGRYFSAFDGKVHNDEGTPFFTDDWIWDSYRAHHPLNVLIDTKKEGNILQSFVRMSEQMDNFWLPTFPEINGDSRRMNSNHGVAAILDAYEKGIRSFNVEEAYRAAKGAITEKTLAPWSGKPAGKMDQFFVDKGYIPALNPGEKEIYPEVHDFERRQPVAVTLGTSYDLWCLAQLAKHLGKTDEYDRFMKMSFNYRNLFNQETKFFHPKDEKGQFIQPFDYVFSGGQGAREYYGENNAWIYRWDVQHNIPDLINLMGGNQKFVQYLDEMFVQPLGKSKFDFYQQLPDHTGNVGQFSMANEPSLHIPYLYNYAGQPWMTQKRIKTLIKQWFRDDLMGVPGDEDGGGLSSFVVFSQLGFYPVTPGSGVYSIGSPFFEKSTIKLENGKTFTVLAKNASDKFKYIQSAKLNGKLINKPEITHKDILQGGTLELEMGDKANKNWGVIK